MRVIVICCLLAVAAAEDAKPRRHEDPFALLDRHISHTLAHHYLWPWSQLMKAAEILDYDDEEPQIKSNKDRFEIWMNVKRFQPDELRIKVKNRYIIVEGRTKPVSGSTHFIANHFVQRFVMPPGSRQEEVEAELKNGILTITAPKHDVPPPLPEREIPIKVIEPEAPSVPVADPEHTIPLEQTTQKEVIPPKIEEQTEKAPEEILEKDTEKPIVVRQSEVLPVTANIETVEATTHAGKIRKKELKNAPKTTRDNEVIKTLDGNVLDYAFISEE